MLISQAGQEEHKYWDGAQVLKLWVNMGKNTSS